MQDTPGDVGNLDPRVPFAIPHMHEPIAVDSALWPLVRIAHSGAAQAEDYARLLRGHEQAVALKTPFAVLAYGDGVPDSDGRRAIAQALRERREDVERYCVGMAVVIDSPAQRSALTAIHWACQPDTPFAPFSTYAGALQWCTDRLERRRALPRRLAEHLQASLHTRSTVPPSPAVSG